MTMLVAWIGIDARVQSSAYIATDSRITYPNGDYWDAGPKVFASAATADIFGFVGTVEFPLMFLTQFLARLDSGTLGPIGATLRARQDWLLDALRTSISPPQGHHAGSFSIVHVGRSGFGQGTLFEIFVLEVKDGRLQPEVRVSPGRSSTAVKFGGTPIKADPERWSDGSGRRLFESNLLPWQASPSGGTSRSVFSAFCDALRHSTEPTVGGAPQLVGLRKKESGLRFGVRYNAATYVSGSLVSGVSAGIGLAGCFNELFERVDLSGRNVPSAARHARP